MCHRTEGDTVNEQENNMDRESKDFGDNSSNFFSGFSNVQPFCSCMGGSRRIRKRHPATVQTPGRQFVENEVMEPLVNYLDRLEPSFSQNGSGQNGSGFGQRDYNDNFRCDDQKFYETQFVMEFSHLKMGSQRHGTFDDSATRDNLKKARIMSSKLK
eukprot:GFUD01005527.1.p1 GENE.GFUD01005527.1~~GFUD01005527.1.p1  ORF type:complete len:157 (-),score=29.66 GFUD01005527.1:784-1254(-)